MTRRRRCRVSEMILLRADPLTLLLQGHPRVPMRMHSAETDVATTIITWMEVMQGASRRYSPRPTQISSNGPPDGWRNP